MAQVKKLSATIAAGASNQALAHTLARTPDLVFIFEKAESVIRNALKTMCFSDVASAIGTAPAKAKTAAVADYTVDGIWYTKAATDDFWTLTGFNCSQNKYNKCLLCIDTAGAAQIAAGTEADTAAAVVLPAVPANSAVVALLEVHPTSGAFTGGTTALTGISTFYDVSLHPLVFPEITLGNAPDATNVYVNNSMQVARAVEIVAMALHSIIK